MAVSALTVLLSNCLEESQFVSEPARRKRLVLEGPQAALLGSDSDEDAAGRALLRWPAARCLFWGGWAAPPGNAAQGRARGVGAR